MKDIILNNISFENFIDLCTFLNCKTLLDDIEMYYNKYLLCDSSKYYLGFYLPTKEYLLKDIGTINMCNSVNYKNIIKE